MSTRIFCVAALLAAVAQAANVNVHNNCNFAVKAVPSNSGTDNTADEQTLQPGHTYTQAADGSAWCLKLYAGTSDGKFATSPTQLEWSNWNPGNGEILSYDLSDIDVGDATSFLQHGMNLTSEDPSCDSPSSTCRPAICSPQTGSNVQPCKDAYNQPYDVRTLGASAQYDINMVLCTESSETSGSSGSSSGSSGSSAPANSAPAPSYSAPAPAQTTLATSAAAAAPAPSNYGSSGSPVQVDSNGHAYVGQAQENSNVVTQWVQDTDVVTQIVTARNAEPTLEKRHQHHHGRRHNYGQ